MKHKISKRKRHAERSRFACEMSVHAEKRKYAQRNIDKQRHITHAEIAQILYHYGNTVYSGRSKIVGDYKQHVAERIKTAERKRKRVHPQFIFQKFFECHIINRK